jgi:hypothetical protein
LERLERRYEQSKARQTAIAERRAIRDRLDCTDRAMAEYFRSIGKCVDVLLMERGYHRHNRGERRRRRTPMLSKEAERYNGLAPLTRSESLAECARGGDLAAPETVLEEADRHHHETVEAVLLQSLPCAPGARSNDEAVDYVCLKMAKVRYDLAPPGSSAAEKLLTERASVCWLHLEVLESEAANFYHRREVDLPRAEFIGRQLARARARLTQALTAPARIRRLNLPLVVNRVNIGTHVNGAVQVDNR